MPTLDHTRHHIAQTGADALLSQLTAGLLTPDEYHAALAYAPPLVEDGPRCVYCSRSATIGTTCATHADRAKVRADARAACPIINLARHTTRASLTAAVIAALERAGREDASRRFAARAAQAGGMNALAMIAREYVRLVSEVV